MTRLAKHVLFVALFMLPFGVLTASADVSDSDRGAIRTIIESQMDAFQRDDGAAAYSYASPTIQGLFPTVEQFMAMVRGGYQPVYRPQSVVFGEVIEAPGGPLQRVFLTGPNGKNWVAIYSLQQPARWHLADQRLPTGRGSRRSGLVQFIGGRSPFAQPSPTAAVKSSSCPARIADRSPAIRCW